MKKIRSSLAAILFAAFAFAQFSGGAIDYTNPVLHGDFPDPSVIRVGNDYWATATSSEWGPLYPILHSTDLVNWELKGHIFETKPKWSSKNYWAPELTHFNGKFYVYYVARKNEEKGTLHIAVATAENPLGPWADHGPLVGQDDGSIDANVEADEHGDRYMLWKNDGNSRGEPTFIYAQKLSEDGLKLVGEMKKLLRNDQPWEGNLIEGPEVVKHGGYFYIFYAGNGCCGKNCNYGTGVARSKSLLGPYEKFAGNPILAHNETWRCPGHGTVVSTPDGRDYFLYHAYAAKGFQFIGRQGVLDQVKWRADGWPVINDGKGVSTTAASPFKKTQRVNLEFIDDFITTNLNLRWQWPHSLDPQITIQKGEMTLRSPESRGDELFGSVVAVQTTTADYAATALVDTRGLKAGTQTGLFAFGDLDNALGITLGDGKVTLHREQRNKTETLGSIDAPALPKIYLRMEAKDGHLFHFAVWNGTDWKSVGEKSDLEGGYLPPWDRGVRVAVTIGGTKNAATKIDWLRVTPK
jgi:beta-xylosidase